MNETLTIQFDGGSRGNPGPAGIGVVIRAEDDTPIFTLGRFIGRATNNVAEYRALITGLEEALKLGAKQVLIRGDSELIVRQMTGIYKVKHPDMKRLFDEAKSLLTKFDRSMFEHNLRHKNELADKLANLAMDKRADVLDADDPESRAPVSKGPPQPLAPSRPPSAQAKKRFTCAQCGCAIEILKPSSFDSSRLNDFACQCGETMQAEGAREFRQV